MKREYKNSIDFFGRNEEYEEERQGNNNGNFDRQYNVVTYKFNI
jgi:hypothetical protein